MTTTSHVYHPPSTCVYNRKSNEQTTTSYYSQAAGPCTFETKWCQLSGLANMASWKSWGYRHKISPTWKIPWNRQEIFLLQITKLGLGSCVINGSFCYNEGSAHLAFKGSRHRCGTLVAVWCAHALVGNDVTWRKVGELPMRSRISSNHQFSVAHLGFTEGKLHSCHIC